ncbi:MAG: CAP domain-containing protein, partial [Catenulispora sp.]
MSALPVVAHADPAWSCAAATGWLAAGGQRADSPAIGATPCPGGHANADGAGGPAGSLVANGQLAVDGGSASQTTDTRKPQASIRANSLTIRNGDGKLVLTASKLDEQAQGSCDANRQPVFTSSGTPGSVTLNGRPVDTTRDYSEPGVGVNGAPLFGKITIHFDEVAKTDTVISRNAIHVIVTDRNGAVVFEAVAGVLSVGRDGAVCDPPPVCPPGQQPQAGRCVDVTVTPLPQPPPPAPPVPPVPPAPIGGPGPQPSPKPGPKKTRGCRNADALAGSASAKQLAHATLCMLNVQRKRHHVSRLRSSAQLRRAAGRHARDMVKRRYFSHTEPGGAGVVDRVLHSGYLDRYGSWRIGENLGWGWGRGATPRSIVAAWMQSPSHRRNILNRRFHDVGVAVAMGSPRRKQSHSITYVIDFGGFQLV